MLHYSWQIKKSRAPKETSSELHCNQCPCCPPKNAQKFISLSPWKSIHKKLKTRLNPSSTFPSDSSLIGYSTIRSPVKSITSGPSLWVRLEERGPITGNQNRCVIYGLQSVDNYDPWILNELDWKKCEKTHLQALIPWINHEENRDKQ